MVDSINTSNAAKLRLNAYQADGAAKAPAGSRPPASVGSVDSVTLSDAVSVHLAEGLAEKGPPFDLERVTRIKQAVAEGRYPVDPGRITDAIFQDYNALMR